MGSSESTFGYRIIHIFESSPASKSGLISYLDFIVSANGISLNPDYSLNKIISKSQNCKVILSVYNILTSEFRKIEVLPSNSWGGEGLLGASIRWESWKTCEGLRVLEVLPNSIAEKIGLVPKKDYILGTEKISTDDSATLEKILVSGKKTELFVYNSISKRVRTISIEGCKNLGCVVGEGMINSIKNIEIDTEVKDNVGEENVVVTVLKKEKNEEKGENFEKNEEKKEVAKKDIEIVPPPPLSQIVKEKAKVNGNVSVLPPPSIYDLSTEALTFQPRVLTSKYIIIN